MHSHPLRLRAFRAVVAVLATGALLAGCGGSKHAAGTSTTAAPPEPNPAVAMRELITANPALSGTVTTLYEGSSWSVVQSRGVNRATAVAFHLIGNHWQADRTDNVKVQILGPAPGTTAATLPQVAIEFTSPQPFVESALWVDGTELLEKGGGSPKRGTIYGAPAKDLKPGMHIAVGYARSELSGTAVAWFFRTK